jgi:hypothetical protein
VVKLAATVEQHKSITAATALSQKKLILEQELRGPDSQFALAAFWLMIQVEYYAPRPGQTFNHWHWMPLNLEFDHQGHFRKTDENTVYYEGGESKSSAAGTTR